MSAGSFAEGEAVLTLPGEWERHERTLMAWPCRPTMWGRFYEEVKRESAAVANAVAGFEPLTMVCADEALAAEARAALRGDVDIRVVPMDGSWMRDNGPVYVSNGRRREARHFRFNSYGERHARRDRDARLGDTLARQLGDRVTPVDVVLEGGALAGNGAGTLVVTRHCLMNPNRNWFIDEAEVETRLKAALGMTQVIWLPAGPKHDQGPTGSDGHTDIFLEFIAPDRCFLLGSTGPDDDNAPLFAENKAILAAHGIAAVDVPFLPRIDYPERPVFASYLNFYLPNGAALVPVAAVDPNMDAEALRLIAAELPDREVVGIPMRAHPVHGGAIHCITREVPHVG